MANIELLKSKRRELKMTFDELSIKSGIPKRTLENIFHGITPHPRVDTMQAIEQALDLDRAPLKFTEEEKAAGIGAHGVQLSDKEWDWLELRSEIIEAKGEKGLKAIQTIIQTYLDDKK